MSVASCAIVSGLEPLDDGGPHLGAAAVGAMAAAAAGLEGSAAGVEVLGVPGAWTGEGQHGNQQCNTAHVAQVYSGTAVDQAGDRSTTL